MNQLILLRHGQSEWNKKNIFTGWIDIPLSLQGIEEAFEAGRQIKNIHIDIIYTSTLQRSLMTAFLAMNMHSSGRLPYVQHSQQEDFAPWYSCSFDNELIPVIPAWQLNERMYGELQGMNKDSMRERYGSEQVQLWRRSYSIPPPGGESLKETKERCYPYFEHHILPQVKKGKNVLIVAHGNSLRAIVMELQQLNEKEVLELEIPTGKPLIYPYNT